MSPENSSSPSLIELKKRCNEETENFFRGHREEAWHCYELFRQAVVYRQEEAWEYIVKQYENQVRRWVEQNSKFHGLNEKSDVFVNQAFEKMWRRNFTAGEFSGFPNIKGVLAYLKTCVSSVILDAGRVQSRRGVDVYIDDVLVQGVYAELFSYQDWNVTRLEQEAFWEEVKNLLEDAIAFQVLYASFVLNLKPIEIYEQAPKVFGDVQEVYKLKAKAIHFLSRLPEMRNFSQFLNRSQ